ncbi:MAG: recombination-associated protein RdgC [Silvanigrellales bacterium]|nr:recombination-associated protein RdgC [Silvanigrellales bacterium]
MTLGAGAVAVRRLKLLASPRELPLKTIAEKLRKAVISPLGLDESREESLGFAHPFTGEPDLADIQSLVFDGALVFALRKDSKKIPGTLFRLQLKAALDALQKASPRDADESGRKRRLTRSAREQAKERIKHELMKRTLPSIRLVEIVWHLDASEIWILSTSAGALEDFEKLFFETFETGFIQMGPGTATVDFDRIHQGLPVTLEPLLELVPLAFVRPGSLAASIERAPPGNEAPIF